MNDFPNNSNLNFKIHSRLSRCSKARGSSTGLSLIGPTKVSFIQDFSLHSRVFLKLEYSKVGLEILKYSTLLSFHRVLHERTLRQVTRWLHECYSSVKYKVFN